MKFCMAAGGTQVHNPLKGFLTEIPRTAAIFSQTFIFTWALMGKFFVFRSHKNALQNATLDVYTRHSTNFREKSFSKLVQLQVSFRLGQLQHLGQVRLASDQLQVRLGQVTFSVRLALGQVRLALVQFSLGQVSFRLVQFRLGQLQVSLDWLQVRLGQVQVSVSKI